VSGPAPYGTARQDGRLVPEPSEVQVVKELVEAFLETGGRTKAAAELVVRMNPDLFRRIKSVYEQRDDLQLSAEQRHVLEERMAKTPTEVYDLLNELWEPSLERAQQEARTLQE